MIFDAILNKQPTSPLRLNPELPVECERILEKALEKDRDVRYQTAAELRADLKRLKRDLDSGRTSSTHSRAEQMSAKVEPARRKTVWLVIAVLCILAASGIALYCDTAW